MFLNLAHTKLNVYNIAREFVLECYRLSKILPTDERFAMVQQLRRAALSVHLNIAEGSSRRSISERKRFYEISRSLLIEVDAIFDIAVKVNYFEVQSLEKAGTMIVSVFKMLSKMMSDS